MQQNFFDYDTVFEGYSELRGTDNNCNVLMEQPAMAALLPALGGKAVLDLGCGFGHNCVDFVRRGARRVLGLDISEKMLKTAQRESSHSRIEYRRMSMTDIGALDERFDLIYSSLAVHYMEDFPRLMGDAAALLSSGGVLLFSQEHPIATASVDGAGHYLRDGEGVKTAYCFSDYGRAGIRENVWFDTRRTYYHRTVSDIINAVAGAGLVIDRLSEPVPDENMLRLRPSSYGSFHKPLFLLVKAHKP